jgi:hypothetical protein
VAIAKEVYKWERIVPVRFARLVDPANVATVTGPPRAEAPDVDDRGYIRHGHGPIVGMIEGTTIKVRLSRENIENDVLIFATSSDTAVITVESTLGGVQLPNTQHMWIQIEAAADTGGNPATAKVEIRFGTDEGPIISELTVHIFEALSVDITPHVVTISRAASGATAAVPGTAPVAVVADIMAMVSAIWKPCGVTFNVQPIENDAVNFATANIVSDNPFPGEVNTLLSTNWVADTINVYIVRQIGTARTLGYGISRASARTFRINNPGVILAETNSAGAARDTQYWANDLAHELGHFFGLWHPGNKQGDDTWQDSWSRRMLMHNFNRTLGANPPSPRFGDSGYGTNAAGTLANRGCFITMKNYRRHATDGECTTSRRTVSSRSGPY